MLKILRGMKKNKGKYRWNNYWDPGIISKGDYEKIEVLKPIISLWWERKGIFLETTPWLAKSIDNLKKKREEINNKIKDNYLDYFAKEAGIVSFKIDNYEEIYSFQHR